MLVFLFCAFAWRGAQAQDQAGSGVEGDTMVWWGEENTDWVEVQASVGGDWHQEFEGKLWELRGVWQEVDSGRTGLWAWEWKWVWTWRGGWELGLQSWGPSGSGGDGCAAAGIADVAQAQGGAGLEQRRDCIAVRRALL